MKTKKDGEFSWWDEVPIEEDAHDTFDLEDILREFGDGEVPEQRSGDPALRSPVPRHITATEATARHPYPRAEAFPPRQIPAEEDSPKADTKTEVSPPPATKVEHPPQNEDRTEEPGRNTIPFAPVHARGETVSPELKQDVTPPPEPPKRAKKRHQTDNTPAEKKHTPPPQPPKPPKRKKPLLTAEARFRTAQEGTGGRKLRLALCLLLTALALVLGFSRSQGVLNNARQELLSFGESTILILCAICASDVLVAGIVRLLRPGFDLNTLAAVETILGLVHGFMCLRDGAASYCPLICLVLCASLWGLQKKQLGTAATMDAARKTNGKTALCREPDFHQKHAAIIPGSGTMEAFLAENDQVPAPQRIMDVYGLVVLLVSLVGAILAGVKDAETFIRNWIATMVAGTSLCGFLVWSRPWAILSEKLKERCAALYGWSGAGRMAGKVIVPISDEDLFSTENLKLNGMKFFGGANPDRVLAYSVAIMEAAGIGLSPLFRQQLEQRGGRAYNADRLRWYEAGGVGGEIMSDSVLVGSLRFMQSMGVDMPPGTKVSQAVYVAIEGELAGVFAIHYGVSRNSAEAVGALSNCHGLMPTITAGDFIITGSFLKAKFRTEISEFHFPPLSQRSELRHREAGKESKPCVLLREYRFSTVALAVSGARALRTAVCWGTIVSLLGGLMGLAIMVVLTLLNARDTMSLTNLGFYMMLWAVPGLLLSGWPKNV